MKSTQRFQDLVFSKVKLNVFCIVFHSLFFLHGNQGFYKNLPVLGLNTRARKDTSHETWFEHVTQNI